MPLFFNFEQLKVMWLELIELQMTRVKQIFNVRFAFVLSQGHSDLVLFLV